jgi:hypothetical protein
MLSLILGIVSGIILERVFHIYDRVSPSLIALLVKAKAWIVAKLSKNKPA